MISWQDLTHNRAMLNQNGMLDCSCLASTQEEADTRIIWHALYSDKLYQESNVQGRIVVKSPDTDVLVLLVHYFPNMKNTSELWFQTGLRALNIEFFPIPKNEEVVSHPVGA
jgi:hypothetical protein